jgi:hypothetical protein
MPARHAVSQAFEYHDGMISFARYTICGLINLRVAVELRQSGPARIPGLPARRLSRSERAGAIRTDATFGTQRSTILMRVIAFRLQSLHSLVQLARFVAPVTQAS